MATFTVDLADALDPFVLAVDVGSTASRGGLYDARGLPVSGHRHKVPHAFTTATDGTSVIEPRQVLDEVEQILDALARPQVAGRVAGVALDTFASSLVGVDAAGDPLTPCFTYADSRCAPQVAELRAELDESEVQQRTGCRLHTSYLPARLRWLRSTQPDVVTRVARWLSLGEYLTLHLAGVAGAGTSTAAWTGLLDRLGGRWDGEMLAVAGISADALSPIHHPDEPLPGAASRWPALDGAAWFAVVADGFAANVGSGARTEESFVASFATSGAVRAQVPAAVPRTPAGLWAYRVDGASALLGGALNDVGRAAAWLEGTLRLTGGLDEVLAAEPEPGTPLVLPFFTGERSTGWAAGARAVLADVSAASTPESLARGVLEGIALTYGRVVAQLREVARPQEILASGRTSQSLPRLLQLLADVTALPVTPVTIKRSTLHGTALLALDTLAPGVERAAPTTGPTLEPVAARGAHYAERAERFARLYAAVVA